MKIRIDPARAYRMINSGCLVLLTAAHKDRTNVMTIAWHMPVSMKPPLVAVALGVSRFTTELVDASGEFAINIPPANMLAKARRAGSISGRDMDKLAELDLAFSSGKATRAPVLQDCLGYMECKVVNRVPAGDHTVYIAEVVSAAAEDTVFDGAWLPSEGASLLFHLGGPRFVVAEKQFEDDA